MLCSRSTDCPAEQPPNKMKGEVDVQASEGGGMTGMHSE